MFISWSGRRSGAAAEALRGWLPKVINAIEPWLSAADIEKGARWSSEIAARLKDSKAGIICLTPSNLHSDWIMFEAGALSKTIEDTYVCPFLIGLEPADVKPPLSQFHATRATKSDVLKLVKTLYRALGEFAPSHVDVSEVFEVWWPRLEKQLKDLPGDEDIPRAIETRRDSRDLMEEILALVRNLNRTSQLAKGGFETVLVPESRAASRFNELTSIVQHFDNKATNLKIHRAHSSGGDFCKVVHDDGFEYFFVIPDGLYNENLREYVQKKVAESIGSPEDPPRELGDNQ